MEALQQVAWVDGAPPPPRTMLSPPAALETGTDARGRDLTIVIVELRLMITPILTNSTHNNTRKCIRTHFFNVSAGLNMPKTTLKQKSIQSSKTTYLPLCWSMAEGRKGSELR